MERLMPGSAAPTHELLRLCEPIALTADEPVPPWVEPALRRTPWVVVRRGRVRDRMMPVGVRGPARSQRFAAYVKVAELSNGCRPKIWPRHVISSSRNREPDAGAGRAGPGRTPLGTSRWPLGPRRQCRLRNRDHGHGDNMLERSRFDPAAGSPVGTDRSNRVCWTRWPKRQPRCGLT